MILRNKKTGEIVNLAGVVNNGDRTFLQFEDDKGIFKHEYETLNQLNKEWEDIPEESVNTYWFVNDLNGEPMKCDLKNCRKSNFIEWIIHRKEIDNYFETKEEAELAVRKLKAWKRLKDIYHISFDLDFVKNTISFTYQIDGTLYSVANQEHIIFEDMKTIFGDEK